MYCKICFNSNYSGDRHFQRNTGVLGRASDSGGPEMH